MDTQPIDPSNTNWTQGAEDILNTVVELEAQIEADIETLITWFYDSRERTQETMRASSEPDAKKTFSPINLVKRTDNGRTEIRWVEIHFTRHGASRVKHRKYVPKPSRNKYHKTTLRAIAKDWEWDMVQAAEARARAIRKRVDHLIAIRKQVKMMLALNDQVLEV